MRQRHRRLFRLCCGLCLLFVPFASPAQKTPIALTGTLVTPQEVVPQGTVLIQNGRILASGATVKLPAGTKVVHTDGVIAPGLIDLHNHLTWNVLPRWKSIQEFGSRYDWQQKPISKILLTVPHDALVKEGLECEMERYAEVKAISEGETSVVGSPQLSCVHGLARNLDYDPELDATFGHLGKILYNVFPFQMSEQELAATKAALSAQPRGALLIHVAEGAPNDASAAREFTMLKGRGLLLPGVSLIHGVALKPENFAEMAKQGVGFIWSPRSNIELYGDTANVAAAQAAGVRIALAPDWSPTGSDGLLGELNYASIWNQTQAPPLFTERDLVLMATSNAAELAGLSGELGSLAAGQAADLMVVRKIGQDAYWSLTHSTPQALQLVLIGGVPMYGDPSIFEQLTGSPGERLEICGTPKAVVVGSKSFAETETTLDNALHQFGTKLAPLAECGN